MIYAPRPASAWTIQNADGGPHPVGGKAPNAWGFEDMLGNAWEFCGNAYDGDLYRRASD
ncbi:MAG: sulfatase modifying factor 1 [Gammaproteobacteria bacterium]